MISEKMKSMLIENVNSLVKPAKEIAVIGANNNLDHALLLMTSDRYSVVPVIDEHSVLKGLISMPIIMDAIIDIDDVRFDKLGDIKVKEIMDTDYPFVSVDYDLEEILNLLVHHSFISVVDEDGKLEGIITRQKILGGMNRILHNFETRYEVVERSMQKI